nr:hypothetical protein [Oenococcus oeni]
MLFFGQTHLAMPWFWASIIACVLSLLFAFISNKKVVFNSGDMTFRTVLQ